MDRKKVSTVRKDQLPSPRGAIDAMLRARILPKLIEGRPEIQLNGRSNRNGAPLKKQPGKLNIAQFVDCLIEGEQNEVDRLFEDVLLQGHRVSDLFLDLLGPSAVELGERWTKDLTTFADVTMGVSMLHNILRSNSSRLASELVQSLDGCSIFVTPMPGQNHFFGAAIVEEFFRAANWNVHSGIGHSAEDILDLVTNENVTIVGLSVAHNDLVEDCKDFIATIRKDSVNQKVKVMVGGPIFVLDPTQVNAVGADATASDARQALEIGQRLSSELSSNGGD